MRNAGLDEAQAGIKIAGRNIINLRYADDTTLMAESEEQKSPKYSTWMNLKNDRMISVRFQGKPFNITVIQVYALTSNAEEAEVELFYEDMQDLLELTPKKDVLFFIGDWNARVGSQKIPGVTGKFRLGVQNEGGKRLTEFCQRNTMDTANTLLQQHKRRLYTWTSTRWSTLKSD